MLQANPQWLICLIMDTKYLKDVVKPSRQQDQLYKVLAGKKGKDVICFQDMESKYINQSYNCIKSFSAVSKQENDGFLASSNGWLLHGKIDKPHAIKKNLLLSKVKQVFSIHIDPNIKFEKKI